MEQFDKKLREMAEREAVSTPEGFDNRLRDTLDSLPPKGKHRRLGAVKGALIAAAACVLLVGTALAASPTLRDALSAALGGFAPYAQEQEDQIYVVNEFEYQVLSAVSDGATAQIYVQQRDLVAGRNHTEEIECDLFANGSGYQDSRCVGRDESTGTSLWRLTRWGQLTGEPGELTLFARGQTWETSPKVGGTYTPIPLKLEVMPSMVIAEDTQGSSLPLLAETIKLSPLGLTVVTRDNPHNYNFDLFASIRVCLLDGTEILPEGERASGQGTYGDWEDPDSQRKVLVWNFQDAVDLDQVEGVYVENSYFPVNGLSDAQ